MKIQLKRFIWDFIHMFFVRDIIGPMEKSKYGNFGKGSRLFLPKISDKNKRFVNVGDNTFIGSYSRICCYPNKENKIGHLNIGDGCRIGIRDTFLVGGDIIIQDNVLIASDVLITSENHSIDPEISTEYMSQPLICKNVLIKSGAWIGEKACILPGVTIGTKSIVGAGSVVTKSVPDYTIAVGNPAKVIKKYNFEKHLWESIKN